MIKKVVKKKKNKKGGQVNTITKTQEVPSFFSYFKGLNIETYKLDDKSGDEEENEDKNIGDSVYKLNKFTFSSKKN